jgi:hypothetical protein
MEPAGADADALCAPVERLLRPAGSGAQAQVQSMLALLRSGRPEDALEGCTQLVDFASDSMEQEPACDGREVAGAAGAVAAVVSAMRTDTQWLQQLGCVVLACLCREHEGNCARAGVAGAIEAVLTATELVGTDNTSSKLLALHALTDGDAHNAAAAIDAGALECVVAVMRAHRALEQVQDGGCHCFLVLVELDAPARARAIAAGAIDAVLDGMAAHASSSELSANGCYALKALYGNGRVIESSAHARARAKAAVRAVLKALDAHRSDEDVQSGGCDALNTIARTVCIMHAAVGAAGAVPSVLAALRAHPGSADVQESGIAVLSQLCAGADGKANAAAAVAAGAVPLVLAAMGTFLADERVQGHSCLALAYIVSSGAAVAAAQHARMAEAVVRTMQMHASSVPVQRNGCHALGDIAVSSPASLDSARGAGAIEAVVGTLRGIQRGTLTGCDVLISLCVGALIELMAATAAGDVRAAAAQDAAVRAGAMERVCDVPPSANFSSLLARIDAALADAARRHDTAPCAHAAACERCAAFRARGKMCWLPSCGARRRTDAGDAKKKLLRCARCEMAMYCSRAHQTADWAPRHKAECREPQAAGGASGNALA